MPKYYMGIDIGTFESKGVLIDEGCRIAAQESCPHGMENPREGFYEHDAEAVWWGDFCRLSKALIASSGVDPADIACVGGSTLGSDCLPVDENCRPLRKAILYGIDSRAVEEIRWLTDHYGPDRVRELFGGPIVTSDVSPKILWIKNNEPEVWERACKFLTGASFIAAKLTGNYVIDQFLAKASFKPLYRADGSVNEEECALYCRPDQLAAAQQVNAFAGRVTAQAARETGLAEGTAVITGTGDSTAEAISVGVLDPGDMMLQFGSTLFIYCCTDHLVRDDRVRGNNFTVPGCYSVSGATNTAGTLTRWYRDVIFPDLLSEEAAGGKNAFTTMVSGTELYSGLDAIPAGSDGLITLPYFAGERTPVNDPSARGLIFGLTLKHGRAHMYKSALEGVGYSIAQHADIMEEHGIELKHIMAVGGGTKNAAWMQITADILGRQVEIPEVTVGASYGDALMAALADGRFQSFKELRSAIRIARVVEPDMESYGKYQKYKKIFGELYERNKDLMHQLK